MSEPIIPPKTQSAIDAPVIPGTRHEHAKGIAHSLIAQGNSPAFVFGILKSKFGGDDFSDREIDGIIKWSVDHPGEPCAASGSSQPGPKTYYLNKPQARQPVQQSVAPEFKTAIEYAEWWANGARMSPDKMAKLSPLGLPENPTDALKLAFGSLFTDSEHINLVGQFVKDGNKAKPLGKGRSMLRDEWIKFFTERGPYYSDAGCWMRINPVNPVGSGKDGAVTDADVTDYRYMLLESDSLPIALQLAFFYRLKLPISAVVLSGGGSAHAWVKVGAVDGKRYSEIVNRILGALEKFGIDRANKNPSRLTRCPSAIRTIDAQDGGLQRLVWLNPNAPALTDQAIIDFEQSLQFPAIDDEPLHALAVSSIARYEWMQQNKGKLGVPLGIPPLDKLSGGLKPGQTMVVAGETGQGKSTYAMHMIKESLKAGIGVLLFSLEMDREEIFDLLMSDFCSINRNKFNNGDFNNYDFEILGKNMPGIAKYPLFIEDSPMTGIEQARLRTMQLLAAKKIGLVVVDYIQFMNPGMIKDSSREQQVAQLSHALRAMARETKLPFVVLSQLNDEGRLRESRVIAHNANIVARISTSAMNATVEIVKGRGIPCHKYILDYNRMFGRFSNGRSEDPSDDYINEPTRQRTSPDPDDIIP